MEKKVKSFDEFNRLFEYKVIGTPLTEDETSEMDSISQLTTGIPTVGIWVGHNSKYTNPMVKVSNIPNDPSGKDCFTVYIPSLEIEGVVNMNYITGDFFDEIKQFLSINTNTLIDYFNGDIDSDDFDEKIKSIKKYES